METINSMSKRKMKPPNKCKWFLIKMDYSICLHVEFLLVKFMGWRNYANNRRDAFDRYCMPPHDCLERWNDLFILWHLWHCLFLAFVLLTYKANQSVNCLGTIIIC